MHDTVTGSGFGPQANPFLRLPAEMQALPQWCVTPGTADDKAPRDAKRAPDARASSTNPATWADFETACRVALERGWLIGFVFTADDAFACIDLDVKDDTPAEQLDRYTQIVETFDSYTEVSRSGRGVHILLKANIDKGRKRDGIEIYSQERFLICTGNVWRDRQLAERQEMLATMATQMAPIVPEINLWGDPSPHWALANDASLDGGELGRLFCGNWDGRYPSQSEADLALVKLLLPHCESPRECWETFRLSALGKRDKAKRADYARTTIVKAMQHIANDAALVLHGKIVAEALFWKPVHNPGHFRLLNDQDLDRLPSLRWLVKRVVPDAGIGAIYGDSGTFKSFLTLDLLAHISNGKEWFGRKVRAAPAIYVPFEGQGGIPNRVKAWRLAQDAKRNPNHLFSTVPSDDVRTNIAVIMEPINLREQADRDRLVATLTENGWAGGVLCIDTLAHASNGIDENSSAMGEMIGIFRDLQARLGGVILLIHHSGKDSSRGMRGWSGLHAAMDFVIECQRDKDASMLEAEFVLTKVKDGTNGIGTRFVLQPVQIGIDEDGDYVSSLVVVPAPDKADGSNPFQTDADAAAEANDDDAFVDAWIRDEVLAGKQPTGRWLEAQRVHVQGRRNLSQKRLRSSIDRLKGTGRLVETVGGPSGAKWLRPVDLPTGGAT